MKVAFDIGGVFSKSPTEFRRIVDAFRDGGAEIFIITDMHPVDEVYGVLLANGFGIIPRENVCCADYVRFGEGCKVELLRQLGIDLFFDDFLGYLAMPAKTIRCLVMPDPHRPYWHDSWVTDDKSDFGRRVYAVQAPPLGAVREPLKHWAPFSREEGRHVGQRLELTSKQPGIVAEARTNGDWFLNFERDDVLLTEIVSGTSTGDPRQGYTFLHLAQIAAEDALARLHGVMGLRILPLLLASKIDKRVKQRGVDFPCEGCGKLEGNFLENGWYRCKQCGYPSK